MNVFVSYHRADAVEKDRVINILKENGVQYYVVENINFDGEKHQYIKDTILKKMTGCDVVLCIIGKETYTRPHIDWELHEALKGGVSGRKGILAVMLEKRMDNKNAIDYDTFPNRLQDNATYIVVEQYASLQDRIMPALIKAKHNSRDKNYKISNKRILMELKKGEYYEIN